MQSASTVFTVYIHVTQYMYMYMPVHVHMYIYTCIDAYFAPEEHSVPTLHLCKTKQLLPAMCDLVHNCMYKLLLVHTIMTVPIYYHSMYTKRPK